jgi:uncharacterized protein YjiS (DUF1127 family)
MADSPKQRQTLPNSRHAALHNPHCCYAQSGMAQHSPAPILAWVAQSRDLDWELRTKNGARPPEERTPGKMKGNDMSIIGKFKEWRSYRRTVRELSALSNRELADLGINRADIPFVARRGN